MSIKILLADDSITIQKVVGIIFGGEDYSLTVVDNGKTAVEKARELNPDVLLIDALMPGMSGYEVCEAVRSTPALSTKPILLLTGSFEPFDENKAKSCGADDFIAKPFESQQIVSKVKELFELGKGRAPAPVEPQPVAQPVAAAQPVTAPAPEPIFAPVVEKSPESPFSFTEPVPAIPKAPQPAVSREESFSPFETTSFAPGPVTAPSAVSTAATAVTSPAIWDAFTPETPDVVNTPTQQVQAPAFTLPNDDVFAMVQEEPEMVPVQPVAPAPSHPHVESQWIPVEEQSFEFSDENVAELPPAVFDTPAPFASNTAFNESAFEATTAPVFEQTTSFGDLPASAFDEPVATAIETTGFTTPQFETSFQEPLEAAAAEAVSAPVAATFGIATALAAPAVESAAPVTLGADVFTAPVIETPQIPAAQPAILAPSQTIPAALTEEQLKAALATVSKDVIERIVWEVVPDLAEVLIKEAIRKIKEGM